MSRRLDLTKTKITKTRPYFEFSFPLGQYYQTDNVQTNESSNTTKQDYPPVLHKQQIQQFQLSFLTINERSSAGGNHSVQQRVHHEECGDSDLCGFGKR